MCGLYYRYEYICDIFFELQIRQAVNTVQVYTCVVSLTKVSRIQVAACRIQSREALGHGRTGLVRRKIPVEDQLLHPLLLWQETYTRRYYLARFVAME